MFYYSSMSATTIKVDGKLLQDIRAIKPPEQSVTSYVREVLEHDIRRQRMAEAGRRYRAFLNEHVDEASLVREWEAARLDQKPQNKRR